MGLAALIDESLVDCRARRLSPKTVRWYADNLRYFTEWLAERTAKQPTFVSPNAGNGRGVHAIRDTDRPLATTSVSAHLRAQALLRLASRRGLGLHPEHVMATIGLPKRPQTRIEPLTPPGMAQCCRLRPTLVAQQSRLRAILLTYLGTGLRATEMTQLLLDDVHLDEGYLRVRAGRGKRWAPSACRRRSSVPSCATGRTTAHPATSRPPSWPGGGAADLQRHHATPRPTTPQERREVGVCCPNRRWPLCHAGVIGADAELALARLGALLADCGAVAHRREVCLDEVDTTLAGY